MDTTCFARGIGIPQPSERNRPRVASTKAIGPKQAGTADPSSDSLPVLYHPRYASTAAGANCPSNPSGDEPRSLAQIFFEYHHVTQGVGIPSNAHEIVPFRNRHMEHRAMLILALEPENVVAVVVREALDGVHELRGDAQTSGIRTYATEPAIKSGRSNLKADSKADRTIVHQRDEDANIVTSAKSLLEKFFVSAGRENFIVDARNNFEVTRSDGHDFRICHCNTPTRVETEIASLIPPRTAKSLSHNCVAPEPAQRV